jgi:hypothetical protein
MKSKSDSNNTAGAVAQERLVRLSSSMLSIANRDADRWGLQITWPEIRLKHCQHSGRRDYYTTGATTIRVAWGPKEICVALSLLGFGIGAIYLPNA